MTEHEYYMTLFITTNKHALQFMRNYTYSINKTKYNVSSQIHFTVDSKMSLLRYISKMEIQVQHQIMKAIYDGYANMFFKTNESITWINNLYALL